MSQITDVMEGLRIAREHGADTVEVEHDEIYVTAETPLDESAVRTMAVLGFDPVEEGDYLWFRRYV